VGVNGYSGEIFSRHELSCEWMMHDPSGPLPATGVLQQPGPFAAMAVTIRTGMPAIGAGTTTIASGRPVTSVRT